MADYTYDAFGNQTEASGDTNPFRYSGEYYDEETGLIYLRARYYDSGVGAFVSEDPARDGLNWYVYANNNAINFFDPFGLSSTRFVNSQGAVNMRTGAGTSNAVITSLASGTEVTFTGNKTSTMIDGHYWAEVTYNGTTGWVAATYLAYERPGTREAWVAVGSHDIVQYGINMVAHHSAIIIFADPNSQLVKDNSSLFSNTITIDGVTWNYGTLGAASDNGGAFGNLQAATNRPSDVAIIKDTVTGAEWQGIYASHQSILSLIELNNNYINYHNGGVAYSATPWPDENKWNSNSYTYSLLTYAGITPPSFSDSIFAGYPGWNQLVPRNMFE